jgi:hypothetical protein
VAEAITLADKLSKNLALTVLSWSLTSASALGKLTILKAEPRCKRRHEEPVLPLRNRKSWLKGQR